MRVTIDVYGSKVLDRELRGVEERVEHMQPAFAELGRKLREYEQALFRTSGASGGTPWPPLQASTIASKARSKNPTIRRNANRILIARGILRASLTTSKARGHVERATDHGLEFGSTIPYGRFHQHGTRHMPARPVSQLTEAQKRDAMRTVQRWIVSGTLT